MTSRETSAKSGWIWEVKQAKVTDEVKIGGKAKKYKQMKTKFTL